MPTEGGIACAGIAYERPCRGHHRRRRDHGINVHPCDCALSCGLDSYPYCRHGEELILLNNPENRRALRSLPNTPKIERHMVAEVQLIGPALAECSIRRLTAATPGFGSGTGLQPPPDNSWDRRSGGEAAAHRARASTRGKDDATAKRDATGSPSPGGGGSHVEDMGGGVHSSPPPASLRSPSPLKGEVKKGSGFEEAPQAISGTSATIPTLDPELARQMGLPTAEVATRHWRGHHAARWKASASRRPLKRWRI